MKITEENYTKIKNCFDKFLAENTKGIKMFDSIGDFFSLHSYFNMLSRNIETINTPIINTRCVNDVIKQTEYYSQKFGIDFFKWEKELNNYSYYPNDCNDNHLETVFKKLKVIYDRNSLIS